MSTPDKVKAAIDKVVGKLVRLEIKDGRSYLGKSAGYRSQRLRDRDQVFTDFNF